MDNLHIRQFAPPEDPTVRVLSKQFEHPRYRVLAHVVAQSLRDEVVFSPDLRQPPMIGNVAAVAL
jgi:hypothetical protein